MAFKVSSNAQPLSHVARLRRYTSKVCNYIVSTFSCVRETTTHELLSSHKASPARRILINSIRVIRPLPNTVVDCFAISVLQMLVPRLDIVNISDRINSIESEDSNNDAPDTSVKSLEDGIRGVIFCCCKKGFFQGYEQNHRHQDAQEFFNLLCDALNYYDLDVLTETSIHSNFIRQAWSYLTGASHNSITHEVCRHVKLPLTPNDSCLDDMIDSYQADEEMTGDKQIERNNRTCDGYRKSELRFTDDASFLLFNLKRFEYHGELKVNSNSITIPILFNDLYRLHSVNIYKSSSNSGKVGHYTTIIYENKKYYELEDNCMPKKLRDAYSTELISTKGYIIQYKPVPAE